MKVELREITRNAEELIEDAGRIAWQTESKGDSTAFIGKLIKMGHESVLEHAAATFLVSGISRACSHQLVRHRLASYTQKSQRYVNEEQFDYVVPPSIEETGQGIPYFYEAYMKAAEDLYKMLQERGVKNEDARFVLPNACTTRIIMTANFREWRHIIKLRGKKNAQWEIREMVGQILDIFKKICPAVFGDLEVE